MIIAAQLQRLAANTTTSATILYYYMFIQNYHNRYGFPWMWILSYRVL